jgi:hypothetical protein
MGSRNKQDCCFSEGLGTYTASNMGNSGQLAGPVQWLLEALQKWSQSSNLPEPLVISTCRSAEKQQQMQKKWDRGDRVGLVVRPVDPKNSRHVADLDGDCWAFDLGNSSPWLQRAGAFVQSREVLNVLPNARWGGIWLPPDPVHFEVFGMRSAGSFRLT